MSLACPSPLAPRAQNRLVTRPARFVALAFVATLVGLSALTISTRAQDNPAGTNQSIYTCPPGATLDGNSCITNATSQWVPGEYKAGAGPVGSCPPEWELDGIFCYQAPATAQPTCPEGGTADPESVAPDGKVGRCVADAVPTQPQCPNGYIAVDDTCFAEPLDASTCPEGGQADPDEIAEDGTVLACQAQPSGTVNGCPANYAVTDGVCTAAPLETDQAPTCGEGELIDGQCRLNAKFASGPNATCNGEPTAKPATECGMWELRGGQRVPAMVNTQPTAVPAPMHILGDDADTPIAPAATATPAIVLNSPGDPSAPQTSQLDLSGGGAAPTAVAAPTSTGITLSTTPTATSVAAAPTGSADGGDSPTYEWGAPGQDTPAPSRRPSLAFTGSAAKPLVVTAMGMMVSGFMAVEFNRRLRKSDARKHLPRRFR